jgi:hypothetical protein
MRSILSRRVGLGLCLLLVVCLAGGVWAAPIDASQAIKLRFVNNNHLPQKVLVVHTYSTARFVKDLFTVIKTINERDNLPASERIKLHIIASSGDPTSSLGISADDAAKYVEVNPTFKSSDIWMQDCMELCAAQLKSNNQWVPAVFDSNRGRGLAGLPRTLADQWNLVYFRNPSSAQAHGDYGGNLEVTPFDDVAVIGNTITASCKKFLEDMGYAGRLFTPDTRWLTVGHIDEYLMYIPTAHAPGGYSIVRADPDYALELLQNMPESELNQLNSSDRSFLLKVKATLNKQLTDPNAGRGTAEGDFIALNRKIAEMIEMNVGQLKDFIRKVANDPNRDFAEVAWPSFYNGSNPSNPRGCSAYLPRCREHAGSAQSPGRSRL